MFTIDQIKNAHSKVKSGADFPNYIQDLKKLGIISYEIFVADGHAAYTGLDVEISSDEKYPAMNISAVVNKAQFLSDLKAHQQGLSDYLTFCSQCAAAGIEKWVVSIPDMTCTYFDPCGNNILSENIPA